MKNILILAALVFLQACSVAVDRKDGAASMTIVYDHRKVEQTIEDQNIANAVFDKIKAEPELANNSHINVTSFNKVILLTGEAPNQNFRDMAESLARDVPKVKRVYNEIKIKGSTSSLSRASDSWITTKIKTQMLATEGLKSGSIKVVTEDGSVYLMGTVTQKQAGMAVDIARQISGVQRVVKVFQYA